MIDWFVPSVIRLAAGDELRRSRVQVSLSMTAVLWGPFYAWVYENVFKDVMLSPHRIVIYGLTVINASDVIYQECNCRTCLYIGDGQNAPH